MLDGVPLDERVIDAQRAGNATNAAVVNAITADEMAAGGVRHGRFPGLRADIQPAGIRPADVVVLDDPVMAAHCADRRPLGHGQTIGSVLKDEAANAEIPQAEFPRGEALLARGELEHVVSGVGVTRQAEVHAVARFLHPEGASVRRQLSPVIHLPQRDAVHEERAPAQQRALQKPGIFHLAVDRQIFVRIAQQEGIVSVFKDRRQFRHPDRGAIRRFGKRVAGARVQFRCPDIGPAHHHALAGCHLISNHAVRAVAASRWSHALAVCPRVNHHLLARLQHARRGADGAERSLRGTGILVGCRGMLLRDVIDAGVDSGVVPEGEAVAGWQYVK
ncbi:MAG: hypothetical protein BWY76_01241 [bacterium ADurb.Bin429]|nr:MAG: hypothetical protein BWY76_01241 [bacterium ADurb.Bin429]